jgi:hypothetical protein
MNQELIEQVKAMFNLPEKWNAYLELYRQKEEVKNQWLLKLKEEATRKFLTDGLVEGWGFNSWGYCDMHWFQLEHGSNSIMLQLSWQLEMSLFVDGTTHDIPKTHELLKTNKFVLLSNCFNKIHAKYEGGRLITEKRNFAFNSPYDSNFDFDRLAWFAGNRTNDFLSQIEEKVDKFRKDDRINLLLGELNTLTKLNKE